MRNLSYSFLFFCTLLSATSLQATHNVAGEIIYRKTGPLTVDAWIVTYTKASSVNADRDSLTLVWGDGTSSLLARSNGNGEGELIAPDYKRNIYLGTHTYAQAGQYTLYLTDPNRTFGIINVNPPSSDNIPFHIQSTVSFLPGAGDSQASPVLLEYPVESGVVGQPYEHMVNAYDADGDSLAYELVVPMQGINDDVPNYTFPDHIMPGGNNALDLDPVTGKITWNAPQLAGFYTLAVRIKSYRNGELVESIVRDMMIFIDQDQFNTPPQIQLSVPAGQVIDVHPGDLVQVDMATSEINAGQTVEVSSTSGLYTLAQDPAQFTVTGPGAGRFTWNVTAGHQREQPYLVVFKAKDDGAGFAGDPATDGLAGTPLASYKVAVFRVSQSTRVRPEPAGAGTLRVYPNPAAGGAWVEIPEAISGDLQLRLLNEQGAVVLEERLPAGTATCPLRLSGLPAAVYTVLLSDGGNTIWLGRVVRR